MTRNVTLTPSEMDEVLRILADPPPPSPALIALFKDYMERVLDGRLVTDTTSQADARSWLEGRGYL